MPCPHNEISIVQRSHRQSAVAAAAYQSGEKLFCEYDQQVKHYPKKEYKGTPLLVRAPVNSFEFQPCGRTPQVDYLLC